MHYGSARRQCLENARFLCLERGAASYRMVVWLVPAGDRSGMRATRPAERLGWRESPKSSLFQQVPGIAGFHPKGAAGPDRRKLQALGINEPRGEGCRQATHFNQETGHQKTSPITNLASSGLLQSSDLAVAIPAQDLTVREGIRSAWPYVVSFPPAGATCQSTAVSLHQALITVLARVVGVAGSPAFAVTTRPFPCSINHGLGESHKEPPGSS